MADEHCAFSHRICAHVAELEGDLREATMAVDAFGAVGGLVLRKGKVLSTHSVLSSNPVSFGYLTRLL